MQLLAVAKLLGALAPRSKPGLIVMGKQAIHDDMNATREMLADLLGWPQGLFASRISIESGRRTVTREINDGLETPDLPCIVAADLRANESRYRQTARLSASGAPGLMTARPSCSHAAPA